MKVSPLAFLVLVLASTSQAQILITPAGSPRSGGADGGGYVQFGGMFDSQPATVPAAGPTTNPIGGTYDYTGTGGIGRIGYVDFGANYGALTLTQIFVELKQYGTNSTAGVSYFWSADRTLDGNDARTVDLGLFQSGNANSDQQWVNTFTGSVPVSQEFLLIRYDSGDVGNRLGEVAFSGTMGAVPEPSTLAMPFLLAVAGVAGVRRRLAGRPR